jgi:hypothetical protein
MTTEMTRTPAPQPPAPPPPSLTVTPSGLEAIRRYERELATYLRELPRLLAEGQAGRHVLIQGDELVGIWDAQGEAIQGGRERFGLEPIFVKTIDPRDPERFALLDAWKKAQCRA